MIEIIVGTNRPNSNSMKVAKIIEARYKKHTNEVSILDLAELPDSLMSPKAYEVKPKEFLAFAERILNAKGLHIIVPEYNGSFPGILKLFIDHLKFPESFERKCVTYTGLGAGVWGAIRAVEQLQMVFGYRNAFSFPERTFLPVVHKKFTEDGKSFNDQLVNDLMDSQVKNFLSFCEKLGT